MADALAEVMGTIAREDFPHASDTFMALMPAAQAHLAGGPAKPFKLACLWFVQAHGQAWKRYALFKRYWALQQPKPPAEDDDEEPAGLDFNEMRDLLYRRITFSVAGLQNHRRALENVADRPHWQLISSLCPWPAHASQDGRVERYTHPFWEGSVPTGFAGLPVQIHGTGPPMTGRKYPPKEAIQGSTHACHQNTGRHCSVGHYMPSLGD